MKTLKFFTAALMSVAAACMVACGPTDEVVKDGQITLSPESLEFTAEGGIQTVDVTGKNWEANEDTEWFEIEQTESGVTVTVTTNDTDGQRSGTITVKNNEDTKTITVKQLAAGEEPITPTLVLSPDEDIEFEAEGGSETITVTTNQSSWDAVSDQVWCVVSKAMGEFRITAAANTSDAAMTEATITVTAGEGESAVTKTLKVNQKGVDIPVMEWGTSFANLYYFEVRSTPEAGYYQLQMPFDIAPGETQIVTVAFYHDIVEERAALNKFPKGTFTIDAGSAVAKNNIVPGTGTPMAAMNGSYLIKLAMGMPEYAILMTGGTMTISGEGDNIDIAMNFDAEDSETGEKLKFKGSYKYEAGGIFKPIYTFVASQAEDFTPQLTKVASAVMEGNCAIVTLTDDAGQQKLQLCLYQSAGATRLADGTYNVPVSDTREPMTLKPGTYSPQEGLGNTYYQELDGDGITATAIPATEGSVDVTSDGDTYNITFQLKGRNERVVRTRSNVIGSFSGTITF